MQKFIDLLEQMPTANITPPTNTIGHIFRHERKENFISDWLAFLLNPEYAGNAEPLSALLELASVTEPVDLSNVSIVRENVFEDKKRIDFFIETNSHIIGIENKILSDFQHNQLKGYRTQLSQKSEQVGKKLLLILLYPRRNTFCSRLEKKKYYDFRPVTYEDLVSEFKRIRFSVFDNLRATVLMEDFIAHMEEYIMQETNNTTLNLEMWGFEATKRAELQKLKASLKNSKEQFNHYIANKLDSVICNRSDREQWKKTITNTYFQLYKGEWEKYQIHFELLKTVQDDFVPSELNVVLHTHEYKKVLRTKDLWTLGAKAGDKRFRIRYTSQDAFKKDMDAIFQALEELINEYTETIDSEIVKSEVVPCPKP